MGDRRVADASADNWVDAYAPTPLKPYLKLMRADRPVGTWLLLWPCIWSITLAAPYSEPYEAFPLLLLPDLKTLILFAIGAFVMRGAGCTINDLLDHEFDAQVARTRSRPLPSGAVTRNQAWVFLALQCLVGLLVLIQFNWFAIILGASSLLLVGIYPLMKRVTNWPQLVLGLTFNWGALLGWAAVTGDLGLAPALLYAGCIAWTLGYDTIYAHQDKEDDALLGLKSTALHLGANTKTWLYGFYGFTLVAFLGVGLVSQLGPTFLAGLVIGGWHLLRQISRTDTENPARCLAVFKSNRDFGLIMFGAFLAGTLESGFQYL